MSRFMLRAIFLMLLLLFASVLSAGAQEYILGEGDLLRITVYDNPDLTSETRVSEGKIRLPLIGEVLVNDMSVSDAEKRITAQLADGYIVKPHVVVFILEYKKTVYVNGEVRNPGAYKITKGLTVLKAITLAGGFTAKAGEGRTKIIRKTENGESTFRAKMNDIVLPDDIILVPESLF